MSKVKVLVVLVSIFGILLLSLSFFTACASTPTRAYLKKDKHGSAKVKKIKGYESLEEWLRLRDMQDDADLVHELKALALKLTRKGEKDEALKVLNEVKKYEEKLKKEGKFLTQVPVFMMNDSSFKVEITTGPFKNLTLEPRRRSWHKRNVSTGEFVFGIKFETRGGVEREKKISRMITEDTEYIIIRDVKVKRRRW